jgi:hypothetical protein
MVRKPQDRLVYAELEKWLVKLFTTFRQEASREAFETYRECLSHLSNGDVAIAFPEAIRRATDGYMPSPGQILAALESVREKFGARISTSDPKCSHCGGTGFRTVPARDPITNEELGHNYKWAVKCDCTLRGAK